MLLVARILLLLFLFHVVFCCFQSWSLYKTKQEGPYLSSKHSFRVRRSTEYKCFKNIVQFRTTRSLAVLSNLKWIYTSGFGECNQQCNKKNLSITVTFQQYNPDRFLKIEWNDTFIYVNKNCDKLYCLNLIKTANSSTLPQHVNAGRYVDCDGEVFLFQKNCTCSNVESDQCQPFWSAWVAGECISTNCNVTGERVKTRKCLYDNESEAFSSFRCSHNYGVIKEPCYTTGTECESFVTNHTLLISVIFGMIITLLLACVIAFQFHKRRTKAKQSRTTTDHSYVEINDYRISTVVL